MPRTRSTTRPTAQWIRPTDTRFATGEWLCYRHQFSCAKAPSHLRVRIACDSKYWLWVNGQVVVREGGLKRGPAPEATYADLVDIGHALHEGANSVAVLVWYFGRHGMSHCDSGSPGLYVEQLDGGAAVHTSGAWKARRHSAYSSPADIATNYRLPESPFMFDAREELVGWTQLEYDDRAWPSAEACGSPPCKPWGALVERPVPMFACGEQLESYQEIVRDEELHRCSIGACAHVHPYLRVRAPAGLRIRVCTDTVCLGAKTGHGSMQFVYVTREGEQEYECPAWVSGHEVHYRIPAGAEVLALKFRRSGYQLQPSGSFWCADQALSSLWGKAANTLLIDMRDTYMDCPDRERAFYAGDSTNELAQTPFVAGPDGNRLTRKCIREFVDWQRDDNVLYAPIGGSWREEIPTQSLLLSGYYGLWSYYLHSGDTDTLRHAYPAITRFLSLWRTEQSGLVTHRSGEWPWYDWGEHVDTELMEQLVYALALKGHGLAARELRKSADAARLNARLEQLRQAIRERYLRDGVFRSPTHRGELDDRVNALALLAGVAGNEEHDALVNVLTSQRHASPYMERFVLEALFELGEHQHALTRMRERYAPMIESPHSTLWEQWTYENPAQSTSTYNHAWSGCAAHLLPQWLAGLRPLQPGWKRFAVRLHDNPQSLYCRVPVASGDIEVRCMRESWQTIVWLSVPPGTQAEWTPNPETVRTRMKINGWIVWDKGEQQPLPPNVAERARDDRSVLVLQPGHYTVESF
jgi:alpha-L-rhamnosidase